MSGSDLPPLRDVISEHNLGANKSLGQHFLTDLNMTGKIARSAGELSETYVIEVGPGPGGLTRSLLAAGCRHVVAIEKDDRFLAALGALGAHYPGRLTVVHDDALRVDEAALVPPGPVQVVANLPYNVGSALVVKWLCAEPWLPWFGALTVMLQKEVVERLAAVPGTKAYGRLSVLAQWRARVRRLFDVPPQAFVPPPRVVSSVVQITPVASPYPAAVSTALQRITHAAFGQRRKMIRSSLKPVFGDVGAVLGTLNIDPDLRAENLTVADYVRLAELVVAQETTAPGED